jgi:HK97 family phage major capsid protein
LVGKVAIPKQTGAGTAYWVTEGNEPTESQQTIGQVTMNMKTVGAYTEFTHDLLMQSSIGVEQFVQNDLAAVVGLALQQAIINGSGSSGQPSGILTQVTPSVIGGTNGLAPTWAHIVGLETNVSVANADVGTLGYLTNAKVRGKLKTTEKFSTTNGMPIWGDGNESPLNGYRTAVTNAVPSNGTKGSGTNLSSIIYGNFADVVLGLWGSLDLMVDPYALSKSGGVRIVALQSADVALRNVESFATMTDAITA